MILRLVLLSKGLLSHGETSLGDGQAGKDRKLEEDLRDLWLGDAVDSRIRDAIREFLISPRHGAGSQGYQASGVLIQAGTCPRVGKPIPVHQLFELG